ncbi:uncharacterized protein LOC135339529 isoform X2 [Halichondria panicea]|uniref:uncharacterized protein LOC135339529 isoform X2 n=1 Tax=Halichondria panicea TaxID=6063 RepID=UPI00312B2F27
MMQGSKIVLPSSDVEEYSANILQTTISRIVNPKSQTTRYFYTSDNRPNWWPKDVVFSPLNGPKAIANGITAIKRRKVLAAFLEKCPDQYIISPPVDQQNSVSTVETDQPEDPAVGAKIVLPSSDAREYYMSTVCRVISHIVNPEGRRKANAVYTSDNRPSWWPNDVAFSPLKGPKAVANGIIAVHRTKVLAAFLEKCPEQYTLSPPVDQQNSASTVRTNLLKDSLIGTKKAKIMADSKIVLPSSDVNEYTGIALRSTISHIVNPTHVKGGNSKEIYKSENCPSWWPKDVLFSSSERRAVNMRKILAAFLKKCPEQYTILPPVDQQNSASSVETDQPEVPIIDIENFETNEDSTDEDIEENVSIPSDPEDLLNSLEQHLLDSRKRRLEAERKVEELTEENKRLKEEMKYIYSIAKRSINDSTIA